MYGVRKRLNFIFSKWTSNCFSTICEKEYSFSIELYFTVCFEIKICESNIVLLFKNCLTILVPFYFNTNFMVSYWFPQRNELGFDRVCVESIELYVEFNSAIIGEYWHLNNIKCSDVISCHLFECSLILRYFRYLSECELCTYLLNLFLSTLFVLLLF